MDGAAAKSPAVVERLREEIRRLQAAPRSYLAVLRTGVKAFDALFPEGGLPLGAAVELWGEAASGRTSLALRAVAAAGREQRLSAWVDGPRELYPPAASALGVDLSRLLIVRPQAPGKLVWTAVQLLRSGAFACVVLDLTHTGVRLQLSEGRKLQDAAQKGGTLLVLLTPKNAPGDGLMRLATEAEGVTGLKVELVRSRRGAIGRRALIRWDALYPGRGPVYRYEAPGTKIWPPPAADAPDLSFERPKSWRERNESVRHRVMPCSVLGAGDRPGRDRPLPSLGREMGAGVH
ncbi:MAG: recombinase RecA [Myxococcaceae bacterium]|nr:recombinase RecA [Myxococcaceae bacterium]